MKLITAIMRMVNEEKEIVKDQRATLDHLKITTTSNWRDQALIKARERHGREFHSHTRVQRVTPPSRILIELNEKSAPQQEAQVRRLRGPK